MSRRRRRDGEDDGDVLSEDASQDGQEDKLSNVSESDVDNDDLDVSEYESVEEETRHSSDEGEKEPEERASEPRQEEKDQKSEEEPETGKDIPTKIERESGDGKEQSDTEPHKDEKAEEKEEDNPAFIPTKGAFFQHDIRSENQPKGRGRERRLWDKDPVKWKHDMFVMEEQMPKSRDHLISSYGYDIRTRSLDAPPPSDARRSRGRGYRGRGRGARPQGDHRVDYSNNNGNYQDEYLPFNEENSRVKHKSRSYYSRNANREPPANRKPSEDPAMKGTKREEPAQRKSNTRTEDENRSSPKTKSSEKKNDEKFSDILQVINNRDNAPSSKEMASTTSPSSRTSERNAKNRLNMTFSNYQEAPKPRRYSSLRQGQTNSPADKQNSQQYTQRSREQQRYSNFSKPVQPSPNTLTNFQKTSYVAGDTPRSLQSQSIIEETTPVPAAPPSQNQHATHQPPPPASLPQPPPLNNVQQPVAFPDPSQTNMGAPPGPGLIPQMPLPYNPMLNPMYFEAAASNYQRMLRMMSQMNMDQIQQMPHQLDPTTAIPADPQSLPHPSTDMQMNPLLLPASQTLSPGTLGSVMRPPHQTLNPPTYFSSPMGMNMGAAPQQQAFPYSTSLVAQQVGGVTYFNTPTQSPPTIPPGANQASPRRNAAVPIMAPNIFGGPATVE